MNEHQMDIANFHAQRRSIWVDTLNTLLMTHNTIDQAIQGANAALEAFEAKFLKDIVAQPN